MEEDTALQFVVNDGIKFLESLTRYYGNEEGIKIWDKIGEAVGKEVKGKIFFAMLTGVNTSRVRFSADGAVELGNAVTVIKAIRAASGFGLKESKDLWDKSVDSVATVECYDSSFSRILMLRLSELGCRIH